MAYTAEISRANPTCFLLLVDQSGSMAQGFGGESGKSKAEGVAEAVNRLLHPTPGGWARLIETAF